MACSGCELFTGPPGEGELAELGYASYAPTIEALAKYRSSVGQYPESLEALLEAGYLTRPPSDTPARSPQRL